MMFKTGDFVKRKMSGEEAQSRAERDNEKARKEGRAFFTGNAAAYLHTNQPYCVLEVNPNGGLRLKGFILTVSPDDVIPASPDDERGPGLRWGR